ncbi:MSMEG_0567/Sll0786 family nitrogen starvation N-acetyltransferase [Cupriavidus sp. UYPR2.512]|uniref:MSMEG_0567/Sll0786 family nitrogen starvation N-acetyltransferase n=1 Tax=Cupriavidus sp. UYPR2.512 TaxID=1080187 RepID=UPI0004759D21|nr:MSMEG_0567/Sll0786 family nitrogen starvation N-acetyltransferase [Cupriavidus sp. UYPR2.512]UIF91001.1 GNAT family N-acetyltransferase [Cupriavidus necator]
MSRDLCVEVPAIPEIPVYRIRWADTRQETEQAHALRRAVFCEEQQLFADDDRDVIDDVAQLLVALKTDPDQLPGQGEVVGTVRIHESESGVWYGSRLAVAAPYRRQGRIGATLIRLAVSSAHAIGCRRFLAHVQSQNVPLFRRLHWTTLQEEVLLGRPHHLMVADLNHYPPCHTPLAGLVIEERSAP